MQNLAKTALYLAVLGAVVLVGSIVVERIAQQVK